MADIRVKLDRLVKEGASQLRHYACRERFEQQLPLAILVFLVCTSITASLAVLEVIGFGQLGWWQLFVLSLVVPLLYLIGQVTWAAIRLPLDPRVCLAVFDQRLGLEDRIQLAHEFEQKQQRSEFEQAALVEAELSIDRALESKDLEISLTPPALGAFKSPQTWVGLGLLLLAVILNTGLLSIDGSIQEQLGSGEETLPDGLAQIEIRQSRKERSQSDTPTEIEVDQRLASIEQLTTDAVKLDNVGDVESADDTRATASQAMPGITSQVTDSNRSTSSASVVSMNAQAQPKGSENAASQERKSTETQQKPKPQQESNQENSSVASGSGSSRGQNTATSMMDEIAQKSTRNFDSDDLDQEAEDEEDEEQEAGNSARALFNKRKAPADRELGISGVSNEENEDANGRGGPGGLKKTRGVAAMLLGVPMPDQLKGQTNPGRIKVERTRSKAKERDVALNAQESRGERDESLGPVPNPPMQAFEREAVRNYFLALRQTSND